MTIACPQHEQFFMSVNVGVSGARIRPHGLGDIQRELNQTGAIATFDEVVAQYAAVPFAGALGEDAKGRMIDHCLEGALDGIFHDSHDLAKEEAAIRNNPAARTTELLKQVFG